jgi:hypothetical protein
MSCAYGSPATHRSPPWGISCIRSRPRPCAAGQGQGTAARIPASQCQRDFLVRELRRRGPQCGQPSGVIPSSGSRRYQESTHLHGQPPPLWSVLTSSQPSSLADCFAGDRLEALYVPAVAPRRPLLVSRLNSSPIPAIPRHCVAIAIPGCGRALGGVFSGGRGRPRLRSRICKAMGCSCI